MGPSPPSTEAQGTVTPGAASLALRSHSACGPSEQQGLRVGAQRHTCLSWPQLSWSWPDALRHMPLGSPWSSACGQALFRGHECLSVCPPLAAGWRGELQVGDNFGTLVWVVWCVALGRRLPQLEREGHSLKPAGSLLSLRCPPDPLCLWPVLLLLWCTCWPTPCAVWELLPPSPRVPRGFPFFSSLLESEVAVSLRGAPGSWDFFWDSLPCMASVLGHLSAGGGAAWSLLGAAWAVGPRSCEGNGCVRV